MKLFTRQATLFLLASKIFAQNIGLAAAALSKETDSTPSLRGANKQQVQKELLELDQMEDMELKQNGNFSESERELAISMIGFDLRRVSNTVDEAAIFWKVPQFDTNTYTLELIDSSYPVWDNWKHPMGRKKSPVAYSIKINQGWLSPNQGTATFNRYIMKQTNRYFQDGTFNYRIKNAAGVIMSSTQPSDIVRLGQMPGFSLSIPYVDSSHFHEDFNASWTIPSSYDKSPVFFEVVEVGVPNVWDISDGVIAYEQFCSVYLGRAVNDYGCKRDSPRRFKNDWPQAANLAPGRYRLRLSNSNSNTSPSKVVYAVSSQTFEVKTENPVDCVDTCNPNIKHCDQCNAGWHCKNGGCTIYSTYQCNGLGYFP